MVFKGVLIECVGIGRALKGCVITWRSGDTGGFGGRWTKAGGGGGMRGLD